MRRAAITDNANMATAPLVIFDDARGRWGPLCDRRAVFELRSGAMTTLERIEHALALRAEALLPPPPLAALVAQRTGRGGNVPPHNALAVNGRCVDLTCAKEILGLRP